MFELRRNAVVVHPMAYCKNRHNDNVSEYTEPEQLRKKKTAGALTHSDLRFR
jgi:hypothetical protein